MNVEQVLSCDWGSSAFRLRVVDLPSLAVSAEESSEEGNIRTFAAWQETGKAENERMAFYMDIIRRHIRLLEEKKGVSLNGLPLLICGMATSTVGMIELPYKEVPFFADGRDLVTKFISATNDFPHDIFFISGVRTNDDVMRGEETKVVGSFRKAGGRQVYILPGTHAKHIYFTDDQVSGFETFMTGELFSLLSKKSILAVSVEKGGDFSLKENKESFTKGIADSRKANCLHNFFKVRTNQLFNKLNPQQNFYYLSALLIGQQLKDIDFTPELSVTLVSDENFTPLYREALHCFDAAIDSRLRIVDAEEALLRGQYYVYSMIKNNTFKV
jgi:2-dehydro-3-deoxygalactonokinase